MMDYYYQKTEGRGRALLCEANCLIQKADPTPKGSARVRVSAQGAAETATDGGPDEDLWWVA
jgi:hypothetical protein